MTEQSFPNTVRLRKTPEFKKVFEARQIAADDVLIVFAAENGREQARLGLSVSRKVGNAVIRNRWKRLIREAFRKHRGRFPEPLDLVVLPQRGAAFPCARKIERSLVKLVEKVRKRINRQG